MSEPDLIICGGGIAGLTAALCAVKAGLTPLVIERAEALSEVGAGLQVGANAMKVMAGLGLDDAVTAAGHTPRHLEMRDGPSGRTIFSVPAGEAGRRRWGALHVNIRRAALQQVLAAALKARAPEALRLGIEAVDYSLNPDGVTLHLADGSQMQAPAVLGADGIHSALRHRFGSGESPNYTGHTALRALVPASAELRALVPDASIAWTGPKRHAVTYYLHGRDLINFVGVVEQSEPVPEGWHTTASLEKARDAFAGFAAPVRAILEEASQARRWGLYDRPPPSRLARGPIALIGDAAAPMPPFMAQGASFAMECAWAAIWSLKATGDFTAYEQAMAVRGGRILEAARRNGRFFHGSGLAALAGYAPVRLASTLAPGRIRQRFDWIYGHDVTHGKKIK
ncbi:MAG: FAD-dependent monooxygenase [Hyphomonadaceae bacterium]|nr:FAD-dependent monooxygenase [Hyphomonadaceae bacterium]